MLRILRQLVLTAFFAVFTSQASAMFIQPDWLDPTTPGVGTNRYAYSFNDPVNNSDPNGNLADVGPGDIIGGIVVGLIGLFDGLVDMADNGQVDGSQGLGIAHGLSELGMAGAGIFSQSNDDPPGIGHNNPPDQDDPSNGDPNNPNPDAVTTAAIATALAQNGNTKTATANDVTITEVDGNTVSIAVSTPTGQIDIVVDVTVSQGTLSIENAHIQGQGPNTAGIRYLRSVAKDVGRVFGVDNVSISGGMRTSGANLGRFPDRINIPVD